MARVTNPGNHTITSEKEEWTLLGIYHEVTFGEFCNNCWICSELIGSSEHWGEGQGVLVSNDMNNNGICDEYLLEDADIFPNWNYYSLNTSDLNLSTPVGATLTSSNAWTGPNATNNSNGNFMPSANIFLAASLASCAGDNEK